MSGHVDDVPGGRGVTEDIVNSLQVTVHGLRVEDVDDEGDAAGDDGVHDIVLVADGVEGDGGDHDDNEVPEPVVSGGDGGHGDTEPDGGDLGTVEEVSAEEAEGVEGVEEEDEEGRHDGGGVVLAEAVGDGEDDHADAHAGAADHEDGATAETVDGDEGDEAAQELPGHGAGGEDAGQVGVHVEVLFEDGRRVHGDQVTTAHLLEELQRHAEPKPVQEAVFVVLAEHFLQRAAVFGADFERGLDAGDFHADFVVFLGDALVGGETGGGFFDAVDADEPTGGFGEEEDGADED